MECNSRFLQTWSDPDASDSREKFQVLSLGIRCGRWLGEESSLSPGERRSNGKKIGGVIHNS